MEAITRSLISYKIPAPATENPESMQFHIFIIHGNDSFNNGVNPLFLLAFTGIWVESDEHFQAHRGLRQKPIFRPPTVDLGMEILLEWIKNT